MIEQPYEIVASKDNVGLSSCLIIVVPKQKDIVTRLKT